MSAEAPPSEIQVFENRYPTLEEVGFSNGGVPGVRYAFVDAHDQRGAARDGFGPLVGGVPLFIIRGRKGEADCQVWGAGRPIHGLDTGQYRPEVIIGNHVASATGVPIAPPEEASDGPREADDEGRQEPQGGKGDARVQKGDAAK